MKCIQNVYYNTDQHCELLPKYALSTTHNTGIFKTQTILFSTNMCWCCERRL